MPSENHPPFRSAEEKLDFIDQEHAIRLVDGVPCVVGGDGIPECLNVATVASIQYSPVDGCWMLVATCREHTQKIRSLYGNE